MGFSLLLKLFMIKNDWIKFTFQLTIVKTNESQMKGIGLYLSGLFVMILNIKRGKRRGEIKRSKK